EAQNRSAILAAGQQGRCRISLRQGRIGVNDLARRIGLDKIGAVPTHIAVAQILAHIGGPANAQAQRVQAACSDKAGKPEVEALAVEVQVNGGPVVTAPRQVACTRVSKLVWGDL